MLVVEEWALALSVCRPTHASLQIFCAHRGVTSDAKRGFVSYLLITFDFDHVDSNREHLLAYCILQSQLHVL